MAMFAPATSIIVDTRQVNVLMLRIEKDSREMRPLMERFYKKIDREVDKNFLKQGSHGDLLSGRPSDAFKKWKSLHKITKQKRMIEGTGTSKLRANGDLKRTMGSVRKVTSTGMEYGTYGVRTKKGSGGFILHHFGGVVTPKRSKYLTLPFPNVKGTARDYTNTFVRNRIIFQRVGGSLKPLFSLKEKVVIPARPYMTIGTKAITDMADMAATYIVGK